MENKFCFHRSEEMCNILTSVNLISAVPSHVEAMFAPPPAVQLLTSPFPGLEDGEFKRREC